MNDVLIYACFIAVAAAFGGSVIYKTFFSPRARSKQALRKAPRVRIAQAKDNKVLKIVGKLRLVEEPLIAPLT
jgi:hypothetical protein